MAEIQNSGKLFGELGLKKLLELINGKFITQAASATDIAAAIEQVLKDIKGADIADLNTALDEKLGDVDSAIEALQETSGGAGTDITNLKADVANLKELVGSAEGTNADNVINRLKEVYDFLVNVDDQELEGQKLLDLLNAKLSTADFNTFKTENYDKKVKALESEDTGIKGRLDALENVKPAEAGAEVNQNAYSYVQIGTDTNKKLSATEKTSILTIKGDNAVVADVNKDDSIVISHAAVGEAGTFTQVTVDANGHVTAGSNPTTLEGYGITDASVDVGENTVSIGGNSIIGILTTGDIKAEGGAVKSFATFTVGEKNTPISASGHADSVKFTNGDDVVITATTPDQISFAVGPNVVRKTDVLQDTDIRNIWNAVFGTTGTTE